MLTTVNGRASDRTDGNSAIPQFLRARAEVRFCARAGSKSRGAEHAVRAKHVDGIKTSNSRAGTPKKANLRGGVKSLRGGNKSASGPPYDPAPNQTGTLLHISQSYTKEVFCRRLSLSWSRNKKTNNLIRMAQPRVGCDPSSLFLAFAQWKAGADHPPSEKRKENLKEVDTKVWLGKMSLIYNVEGVA
ncbi:hypothetical protein B0H11DRAFT_1941956 [Mycena galericulata]|nr:hypothetical protein B0H11DRAFT_1941956 [Mycena galericulata]